MPTKYLIDIGKNKIIRFKGWDFSFPKSPDYEYFQNDEKLIIEYKGKRIACFSRPFERLRVETKDCLLSFGDNNVKLISTQDELNSFL